MVAPNRSAVHIRELELFGKKLGFNRELAVYDVTRENELHRTLDKLLLDLKGFPLHALPTRRLD